MPLQRSKHFAASTRSPLLIAFVALGLLACDREALKASLGKVEPADPRWREDSALVASKPNVLFRVVKGKMGMEALPIATIGIQGFKPLRLASRGWRYFDLQALHSPATLVALSEGRSASPVTVERGMWGERDAPLDSIGACENLVPGAIVPVEAGVRLLTSTELPRFKPSRTLSSGELQETLRQVEKLVAPTKGLPLELLSRYSRTVHQVESGTGGFPTIVVAYDDPEIVPDSLTAQNPRPRNLVLMLDKADYGYQTTYVYTTLGNRRSLPRLEYLDYVDVDGDGRNEIVFGLPRGNEPFVMFVFRHEGVTWSELARNVARRCQG